MPQPVTSLRRADSSLADPLGALGELSAILSIETSVLTIFFCSKQYATNEFSLALNKIAGNAVIGCTSAGEITTKGYQNNTISAVSFGHEDFQAKVQSVGRLKEFTSDQAHDIVNILSKRLKIESEQDRRECFAFLLIDGLSVTEEPFAYKLQEALGEIPLIGGSAGDELAFSETLIYADGAFKSDSAVIVLIRTSLPWEAFKEQHLQPTNTRAVVTEADAEKRVVYELNAEKAAIEYAKMVGVSGPEALTEAVFAKNPFMVQLGGNWFTRSVQKANDDGSLTIYCAIEEGLVLSLAKGQNMVSGLRKMMQNLEARLGKIQLALVCDCIQRRLELENTDQIGVASKVLSQYQSIGFSTYGEQYGSVHINQTLTGIAIGQRHES